MTILLNKTALLLLTLTLTVTALQAQTTPMPKQWDKTFGGSDDDQLIVVRQTRDGGYILGGHSLSGESGDKTDTNRGKIRGNDFWIVKTDALGNKQWDKTYGGYDDDELTALQQTSDGGYILAGFTRSGVGGDKTTDYKGLIDFWMVKVDSNGTKQWDKDFGVGGTNFALAYAVQQTKDGGYIIGGWAEGGPEGDKSEPDRAFGPDFWVVKTDSIGNKEWDRTLGGSNNDVLYALQQTKDGGYILAGTSLSDVSGDKTAANKGNSDYWIVKLCANGIKQWDKSFGGSDADNLSSIQQTADDGYILGGTSFSGTGGDKTDPNRGFADYWIVKTDSVGNKQWDKTYGGSGADALNAVQQTTDGGYILGGSSSSGISGDKTTNTNGSSDYWIIKTDGNGNKQWEGDYGGSSEDYLNSLQQTSGGGFILGGYSNSGISGDKTESNRGGFDYWIVKLSNTPTSLILPSTAQSLHVKVMANPATSYFTLMAQGPTHDAVQVQVVDLNGRVIENRFHIANNTTFTLGAAYHPGTYFVQVKQGNERVVLQLLKTGQ